MLSRRTLQRDLQAADLPGRVLEIRIFPDANSQFRMLTAQGAVLMLQFTPETLVSAAQKTAGHLKRLIVPYEHEPSLTFEGQDRWWLYIDLVEPFDPPLESPFENTMPVPPEFRNPPRPWLAEWIRLNRTIVRKKIRATLTTAYEANGGAGLGFSLPADARLADAQTLIAMVRGFKSTSSLYDATLRGTELHLSRSLRGRHLVRRLTVEESAKIDWGEPLLPEVRMAKWFAHNALDVTVSSVRKQTGMETHTLFDLEERGPLQLRDLDRLSALIDRELLGQPWEWFLNSPSDLNPEYPPISGFSPEYSLVRARHRSLSCGPLQAGVAATVRRWEKEPQLLSVLPRPETLETLYDFQFPESFTLARVQQFFDRMQSLPWRPSMEGMQAHGRGRVSAQYKEMDWRWGQALS